MPQVGVIVSSVHPDRTEHAFGPAEWDEFKTLDWQKIYDSMAKPAFVFDGRGILPFKDLEKIGFKVFTISRGDEHQ